MTKQKTQATDAPQALSDDALDGASGGLGYELKNVMVSSYSISGSGSGDVQPTEEVAFRSNKKG